jgi:hypothetical protein
MPSKASSKGTSPTQASGQKSKGGCEKMSSRADRKQAAAKRIRQQEHPVRIETTSPPPFFHERLGKRMNGVLAAKERHEMASC